MKLRAAIVLAVCTFCVALAVVIGQRLSGEAMAVLLGVIAGVGASIPTSLIVVWLAMRSTDSAQHTVEYRPPLAADRPAQPGPERVVVVHPPTNPSHGYTAMPGAAAYGAPPGVAASARLVLPPVARPRRFTVIGGASEIEELPIYTQP